MLELHIANTTITDGSVAISWCVDKETLKMLANARFTEPGILISVAPAGDAYDSHKERRKIVPLKDLMTWIEFHSSGPVNIRASIVPCVKQAKSYFMCRNGGEYSYSFLNGDGSDYFDKHYVLKLSAPKYESSRVSQEMSEPFFAQPLLVDVPKGVFAPQPPNWEKAWVNHFFSDKVVDQCHYRRRRFFAYGVQPIIMTGNLLLRSLFLLTALLIGSRGFNMQPLLHPLNTQMADAIETMSGGTIFLPKRDKDGIRHWYDYFWLLCMPAICVPLVSSVWLLTLFHGWLKFSQIAGGLIGMALLLVAALFFSNVWYDFKSKRNETKTPWYLEEYEQGLIICNGQPKPWKLSELPSNHRTLKLRFQDLKSRVCKPFSL
jgi:hypothetical protein